jgi:acid phosphatase type 7
VILHGNDHNYQRWGKIDAAGAPSATGIRQFVVGTGGKSHTTPTGTGAQVRNGNTFGVLKLRLYPVGYDWKFIPEPGFSFTDEGSDTCS